MTPETAGFGEQALNKIAEIALASKLKQVERLEVQIKTDLSKLAHGEVESVAIAINGLLIEQDLILEELQLQINRVTVKPLSAILGKIKLIHPSTGIIRAVFNQDDLTRAFNSESFQKHLHQMHRSVENKREKHHFQQVKCHLLANGNMAFNAKLILGETGQTQPVAFTATPEIGTDGQGIFLNNLHYLDGEELAPELIAALIAQVSKVLSLRNFEQNSMSLRIQQLDFAAGKLTVQAATYIQQFPSS